MPQRTITNVLKSVPTMEGAGVSLRRVFGFAQSPDLDPFLLLDDFRSEEPEKYLSGFPWHPHRGIETITYMIDGRVEHGDSLGNSGIIEEGDVQWMTAGSGIIHQEMPKGDADGRMGGFQLWANLPASHKMMDPRYREIKKSQIPRVPFEKGVTVRVIAGEINGVRGPVRDIVTDPVYFDISVSAEAEFLYPVTMGHTVLAYIFEGEAYFDAGREVLIDHGHLVLYGDGDGIDVHTAKEPARFLLISGKPIGEPVAWYGPIVMNTEEELRQAFDEYHQGTFIKQGTHPQE